MYNSIQFVNGNNIWVTQDEADAMSQQLLDGKMFVKLDRLKKTFNMGTIANIGPSQIFFDPQVQGATFSFSFYTVFAQLPDGSQMRWDKGWKMARGDFALGVPFDDFIKTQQA